MWRLFGILLFLLSGGVTFWFFRKGLFFEGTRHIGTGFQRHGSETSSEFVILLRYDMAEFSSKQGKQEV